MYELFEYTMFLVFSLVLLIVAIFLSIVIFALLKEAYKMFKK